MKYQFWIFYIVCYFSDLKAEVVPKKDFDGVIFPDANDLYVLDMTTEPATLSFNKDDLIENTNLLHEG